MASTLHPLDPLTAQEIELSASLIKEHYKNENLIFNSITRLEPPKDLIFPKLMEENDNDENSVDYSDIHRKSFTVLILRSCGRVSEVIVNLTKKVIDNIKLVPEGNHPTFTPDECVRLEKLTLENSVVRERCQALGYDDMNLVVADPWPYGYYGEEPGFENRRIAQMFMYAKEFPEDNHYAHPMNFVPVFDILAEKLIRIDEQPAHSDFSAKIDDNIKIPRGDGNYDAKLLGEGFCRTTVKPLLISSPEGPSFTVDGNSIMWEKFKLRLSFNQREGLVLHNVTYKDGNRVRPLIYRAALSEMVVPYGDPRPPCHRKSAFDVGESSIGYCVNSLVLGCDCLGTIKYFDAILNNENGDPVIIKNAVCLHEEDAGILWKHTNYRTGSVNVVRSRVLVLSFIATVVNYEYGFYWKFSQDGTISFEVKATGILSTNFVADGGSCQTAGHGSIVAPNVNAQYHQHLFNVRLDTMIDGRDNTVSILDVLPLEGEVGSEDNPFGHGFTTRETKLSNSSEGCSQISPMTSRTWRITNSKSINPVTGNPVAWKLIPMNTQGLIAKPGSSVYKRATFATNAIWVTPYNDNEMYAAGFYVNQSKGGGGLPGWISKNDNLIDQDIVLWHTFGLTHIPRVEDYPVMPVETCGFTLKPCNFFTMNPALDVPCNEKFKNCSKQV